MGLADSGSYLQIGLRAESWDGGSAVSLGTRSKARSKTPSPVATAHQHRSLSCPQLLRCQYTVKSKQCAGRQRGVEFLCYEELDLMHSTTTERELRLKEIKVNSKCFLGLKCKSFEPRKATSYRCSAPRHTSQELLVILVFLSLANFTLHEILQLRSCYLSQMSDLLLIAE